MWIVFACGSALFAGITAVLAKEGIRTTDSTVATALRTIVVLAGAWGMVLIVGSQAELAHLDVRSTGLLVLSGLATGASWLCYFKALQLGSVSKVVPIDKLSTVLTVLLAVLLLGESLTVIGGVGVVLMVAGTLLMLDRSDAVTLAPRRAGSRGWLLYALGSAVFAALTAILGKLGIVYYVRELTVMTVDLVVLRPALPRGQKEVLLRRQGLRNLCWHVFEVTLGRGRQLPRAERRNASQEVKTFVARQTRDFICRHELAT